MVFRVDKINYVLGGNEKDIVNLDLSRLSHDGAVVGKDENMSFFTDSCNHSNIDDPSRTHRIRKLGVNNQQDDLLNGNLVNDLFDAKDLLYGSNYYTEIDRTVPEEGKHRIADSRKCIDIYSPSIDENFLGFVSNGPEDFVGMSFSTIKDVHLVHTSLREDRLHRLSNDSGKMIWNFKLSSDLVDTFSYCPLSDLRMNSFPTGEEDYDPYDEKYAVSLSDGYYGWLLSYEELSAKRLSTLFINTFDMVNVERNYFLRGKSFLDINDSSFTYPDYNRGVVATDLFYGKNPFNAEYSMNMPLQTQLSSARKYIGIGRVGAKPFLKYYDETTYTMAPRKPGEDPYYPKSVIDANWEMQTMEMVGEEPTDDRGQVMLSYQNIEIFDATNAGMNSAKHKSNLYSIKINNTNLDLNSVGNDRKLFDKIRTDIQNTVRRIAERLQPAHTQLFKVYIGGTEEQAGGFADSRTKTLTGLRAEKKE